MELNKSTGLFQSLNEKQEIQTITFEDGQPIPEVLSGLTSKTYQYPPENLNLADTTKWVFMIPISYIFPNMSKLKQNVEVPINCSKVEFPSFKIGTTTVGYLGYGFDVSTGQNLTDKGLTITYLANSNWLQYLLLLKWFEKEDMTPYSDESNDESESLTESYNKNGIPIDNTGWKTPADLGTDLTYSNYGPQVPCYLYLLDNFHNRIATILFQHAWLTEVSKVSLEMAKSSGTEVQATFQLKFAKYSIAINDKYMQTIVGNGISKNTI